MGIKVEKYIKIGKPVVISGSLDECPHRDMRPSAAV
jgi:hypothetical protein